MKKEIKYILIIILFFSLNTKGQIDSNYHQEMEIKTELNIVSDDISNNFINTMLYGGFITNEMKQQWINEGDEINKLHIELINKIEYKYIKKNHSYYIDISDKNIIDSRFNDDLLRIIFQGNTEYQDETLNFDNTNIRINRFQQLKIGYNQNLKWKDHRVNIGTALSYINGNHHISYIINEGSLYTSPLGQSLDINYDMEALITDTSHFSLFQSNGKGFALDINLSYFIQDQDNISLKIQDFGIINWNKNSIIASTDSNFIFQGIEINNILEFNDSINTISLNDLYNSQNMNFRSFIPANISISYNKILQNKIFNNIYIKTEKRWHPLNTNDEFQNNISRGFQESNYGTSLSVSTKINAKYLFLDPEISKGGYDNKIHYNLSISKGNKLSFKMGLYHIETLFQDMSYITGFLKILYKF